MFLIKRRFIVYALKCAMNNVLALGGEAEFTENWLKDAIIGLITIIIIMFLFYWILRFFGLLKIK